ncbi:MAG: MFS transporter [Rhodospirillales bacterium]|nr:MFS transporter [Rhodospirillales bacterium]
MPNTVLRDERKLVGLIAVGHFFSHYFIMSLPPLFPLLKAEYGVSYTTLGGVTATYALCSAIAQYPLGILVDRFGARWFLIAGLAMVSVSFIAIGFTTSITALYVIAVVAGLADGVFHPADYEILSASVRKERSGRAYSVHTFTGFAGFAIAPMVIIPLTTVWNWHQVVAAGGIAGLLVAVVMVMNRHKMVSEGTRPVAAAAGPVRKTSALKLITSPPILMMFGFYVTAALANSGITNHGVSTLIEKYGFAYESASWILPAYLWGTMMGVLAGGIFADRFSRLDIMATIGNIIAGSALIAIAYLVMPIGAIIATFFVAGFVLGMVMPARDVLVRAVAPDDAAGRAFGFVNSGFGFGGTIGPIFIGWFLDRGFLESALVIPAIFMIVTMIFALGASRYRPAVPQALPAE